MESCCFIIYNDCSIDYILETVIPVTSGIRKVNSKMFTSLTSDGLVDFYLIEIHFRVYIIIFFSNNE